MTELAHWFSLIVGWITLPCLAIISIFFYKKHKNQGRLSLTIGIITITLGHLIQLFSPFSRMTLDEAGNILSSSGPQLSWYAGSIITSIGLLITVIGFGLITFKNKNT
jgi:uncharacterized membrane protein